MHAPNDGIKLRVAVQRGADMADLSGGSNGILCRDYKGTQAARLVTRIDPGVGSLVAELAATSGRPPRNWASVPK